MDDREKMDEDKEESRNEEIGDKNIRNRVQLFALTFQADVKWKSTT